MPGPPLSGPRPPTEGGPPRFYAWRRESPCETAANQEHSFQMPNPRTTKSKPAASAAKTAKAPNALGKPVTPDAQLAAIVGSQPLPRTELTKRVWEYIKKHGLQDQKDKRTIRADDALGPIFNGKKAVNMFELTRLVNAHVVG